MTRWDGVLTSWFSLFASTSSFWFQENSLYKIQQFQKQILNFNLLQHRFPWRDMRVKRFFCCSWTKLQLSCWWDPCSFPASRQHCNWPVWSFILITSKILKKQKRWGIITYNASIMVQIKVSFESCSFFGFWFGEWRMFAQMICVQLVLESHVGGFWDNTFFF